MDKSEIYRKLKRKGIKVKWIGTTKSQLQSLFNKENEIRQIVNEPIEISDPPEPSRSFVEALNRNNDSSSSNTNLVSANVTFEVKVRDDNKGYTYNYQYPFIAPLNELDERINNYIKQKEQEYENKNSTIKEINRNILTLPTNATENSVLNMPLRQTGIYDVDGFIDNNQWNTTPDECVIDYVVNRLHNNNITREIAKKYLGNTHGVTKPYYTANNLVQFAERFQCNIYITNHDRLIYKAENNRDKKKKCLCFEIRNNHIYPINEFREIRSIIASNQNGNINNKQQEVKEKIYKDVIFNDTDDTIAFMCKIIKENNKMPRNKIKMVKNKIKAFTINNTLYVCSKYDKNMDDFCKSKNIRYVGQTITKYITPYLQEVDCLGNQVPKSFMNYRVLSHLTVTGVKFRNHIGNPYNRKSKDDDVKLDINRCYTSCISNPYDNFMAIDFDTVDIPINEFNNEFGLYYVETNDMTLLHNSNWYSNKILERAKNDNIEFQCKRFIKGRKTDFKFTDIINKLTQEFSNPKLAINSMIGLFARTEKRYINLEIDTNDEMIINICKKQNPFVFKHDDLFFYGTEHVNNLHINYLPIWIQILDWSNIKLHDLIMNHGTYSNLVYRKTDMAIMRNTKVNPSTEIGHYKIETQEIHQQSYNPNRVAYFVNNEEKWGTKWGTKWHNIKPDDILTHMKSKSLLIEGRAGTGKSWYIREFSKNNNSVRLAYTNKAANNIDGKTTHKFFKLGSNESVNMKQVIKADAIFIDEISMIPENIWSLIIDLKNNTNVPIILVGDDRQLPPVDEKSHFTNPSIHWIVDGNKVELTEMKRYDKELWDYLEDPYFLPNSKFNFNATHICYTNNRVNEINYKMNTFHVKNPKIIIDNLDANHPMHSYFEMRLDIGVPLVSLKTKYNMNIIKNETYKIDMIEKNKIWINNKNETPFSIPIDSFDKLFTLGYAMTTHKMQGSTVDGLLQIHEITPYSDRRLFYTAYSRATKLSNISVCY